MPPWKATKQSTKLFEGPGNTEMYLVGGPKKKQIFFQPNQGSFGFQLDRSLPESLSFNYTNLFSQAFLNPSSFPLHSQKTVVRFHWHRPVMVVLHPFVQEKTHLELETTTTKKNITKACPYLDVPLEVIGSMVRINGFFQLLVNGVVLGGMTHLLFLTFDPTFRRNIQAMKVIIFVFAPVP